jgi:hypothetical protein
VGNLCQVCGGQGQPCCTTAGKPPCVVGGCSPLGVCP